VIIVESSSKRRGSFFDYALYSPQRQEKQHNFKYVINSTEMKIKEMKL